MLRPPPSLSLLLSLFLHPSVYRFLAPSAWQHLNVNAGCGPCSRLSTGGADSCPSTPDQPPPGPSLARSRSLSLTPIQKWWLQEDNTHEGNWGIVGGTSSSLIKFSIEGEKTATGRGAGWPGGGGVLLLCWNKVGRRTVNGDLSWSCSGVPSPTVTESQHF